MHEEKILFVLNSLGIGGSEKKIVRIANALHRRGRSVHVAYLNEPRTLRDEIDSNIPVVFLDRRAKFSLQSLSKLNVYLRQNEISKIFCVNLYPSIYAVALRILLLTRGTYLAILVNSSSFILKKGERQMWLYRFLLRAADKVIFGCNAQKEQWIERYSLAPAKCMHIYNGVDTDYFFPAQSGQCSRAVREVLREYDGCFLIGTVGRLNPIKRQQDLITAVGRARQLGSESLRAIIVGEGPSRVELEELVTSLCLQNYISLIGEVNDVRPILKRIGLFVLTSSTETFSNAALEAMAMGKGVILSDVDGAREMLSDGGSGYLYKSGNTDELARLLHQLSNQPEKVSEMGKNATKAVTDRFAFDMMVDTYDNLAF